MWSLSALLTGAASSPATVSDMGTRTLNLMVDLLRSAMKRSLIGAQVNIISVWRWAADDKCILSNASPELSPHLLLIDACFSSAG